MGFVLPKASIRPLYTSCPFVVGAEKRGTQKRGYGRSRGKLPTGIGFGPRDGNVVPNLARKERKSTREEPRHLDAGCPC